MPARRSSLMLIWKYNIDSSCITRVVGPFEFFLYSTILPIFRYKSVFTHVTWKDSEVLPGSFARFYVFPCPNIRNRCSRTFLMEFLDIGRHDVWTVHGWLLFSWFGISASSVILCKLKLREFYERPASSISYIFPLTAILRLSSLS